MEKLQTALDNLKDRTPELHIAVIGDLMLDRYWYGTTGKTINPENPGLPLLDVEHCTHMPGGAANVAMNVRALGPDVILVGTVGPDVEGIELMSLLHKGGINTAGIVLDTERCTTTKTRLLSQDGHLIRADLECSDPMSTGTETRIANYIREVLPDIDGVILSDYAVGIISNEIIGGIFRGMDRRRFNRSGMHCPVVVDPKRSDFSGYAGAMVITPNINEAADALKAMGLEIPDDKNDESFANAIELLMQASGCSAMVLKCGQDGAMLYRAMQDWILETYYPAWRCDKPDVAGAGDTLVAMIVTALSAGIDIVEATALGNLAAGVSVSKPMTATVTLQECLFRLRG